MNRVGKMDTEGNSKEGKLKILKEGLGWGEGELTRVENIIV